ncbi:hypothetical protein SAMN03159444_05419 [Pseudomonas sp. NFACC02]|uniref:hypothetical protein n=1 Tax=Pseudomonas TaxID=286 RepID=UPI000782A82C|nr:MULTISPECIES: hypothetical protein [Pseudomonas]SER92148.1 hypothetical protein SAMN03159444_05419 [Pseudomonas sp. NFACC02]
MRINGPSQRSYPIKRKPRKGSATIDNASEEVIDDIEVIPQSSRRQTGSTANVPARQQDIIFPRAMSTRVAHALSSYLTTSTFVDWDLEVSGLDLHV